MGIRMVMKKLKQSFVRGVSAKKSQSHTQKQKQREQAFQYVGDRFGRALTKLSER